MAEYYKGGFPADAYAECVAMANLHVAPPAPFGWDERMVRFFFQAPVRQPSAPEDTSAVDRILPFPVTINAFYLVNPNEDDDGYPFWIAQIATKGTLTLTTSTRLTVHPPQQRRLKGSGPAAFGGCMQSRLSNFNRVKARLSTSERRRWPSSTTSAAPTG